jgi:flagellar biogenesis protein FliO
LLTESAHGSSHLGLYPGTSLFPSLLKVSGSVLLVLVVILGAAYLHKRVSLAKWTRRGLARNITVLDRFYLNQKAGLFLVRIGSRLLLLGVGAGDVRLIAELSERDLTTKDHKETPAFSDQLDRFLSGLVSGKKAASITSL